ncbi:hypothetical protein Dsin_002589 [Dipteronia sinensis]|uniref:Cytochrome P450 n=1 Tax=Dipteronia sinensis TaxID=43782 RepID=A0AAE0EJE8_9ROSI|nr:hypothetical protein Dsin_002589 [Dipteronia sinensis]
MSLLFFSVENSEPYLTLEAKVMCGVIQKNLPIVGHLPALGSNEPLHRTLGAMADKYGKVFLIRLGIHLALVISSWKWQKKVSPPTTRSSLHVKSLAVKLMGYDHLMLGFASQGPYWHDVRKLATVELLSNHRLELLQHVHDMETNSFIKELYAECIKNGGLVAVAMKERFEALGMNIAKLIAVGLVLVSDTVPFLGWLDVVNGYISKMKKTARELDFVLRNWVDEHRQRRLNRKINEEQDYIHVMLSTMDDGKISAQDANTVIKANCLDQLNLHVGKQRQVDESGIKNLIYLQAIVKDTLGLYPAVPLSAPRESMEDCTVTGFHIPAGTHLFVNLWKLDRDPSIWLNPSEFIPERFLNDHANLDARGLHFENLPFISGRRKCPGISFELQELHLTLAQLLHAFELGTVSDTIVDMSEGPGLTVPKATPLEVILTPRLPSMLYDFNKQKE